MEQQDVAIQFFKHQCLVGFYWGSKLEKTIDMEYLNWLNRTPPFFSIPPSFSARGFNDQDSPPRRSRYRRFVEVAGDSPRKMRRSIQVVVDFPIENGDVPIKNGDFPIEHVNL